MLDLPAGWNRVYDASADVFYKCLIGDDGSIVGRAFDSDEFRPMDASETADKRKRKAKAKWMGYTIINA